MGQSLLIFAAILFAFTSTISPYFILLTYIFMNTGFTALTSSASNEVTRLLPTSEIGSGMGIAQLGQFIGGAIGVTLSGLLMAMQHGLSSEMVYRNIYLFLLFILLSAFIILFSYFRNAQAATQNILHK